MLTVDSDEARGMVLAMVRRAARTFGAVHLRPDTIIAHMRATLARELPEQFVQALGDDWADIHTIAVWVTVSEAFHEAMHAAFMETLPAAIPGRPPPPPGKREPPADAVVSTWNELYPPGTAVLYRPRSGGTPRPGTTATEAFLDCGVPSVFLRNLPACLPLSRIGTPPDPDGRHIGGEMDDTCADDMATIKASSVWLWNGLCPVGTTVRYRLRDHRRSFRSGRTSSVAFLSYGVPSVFVEEISTPLRLSHVERLIDVGVGAGSPWAAEQIGKMADVCAAEMAKLGSRLEEQRQRREQVLDALSDYLSWRNGAAGHMVAREAIRRLALAMDLLSGDGPAVSGNGGGNGSARAASASVFQGPQDD